MTSEPTALQLETGNVRARPAQRDFAHESEADLMVYMSMGDDDATAARDAWAEFYGRHVDYLYAVCVRAYGDILNGDTGVEDLVAETFRRAFRGAHLLRVDDSDGPVRQRRRSRAWLGRIAQRLFQDTLRRRRRLETVHLDMAAWQQVPEPRAAVPGTNGELLGRVREALDQLSAKEQTVIRVTFHWYQPGKPHQRLPNDVAADLAGSLQTTPENLRQIRRRALQKIRRIVGQG